VGLALQTAGLIWERKTHAGFHFDRAAAVYLVSSFVTAFVYVAPRKRTPLVPTATIGLAAWAIAGVLLVAYSLLFTSIAIGDSL
jgi:uncharacterized membrane protein (UPF0136 family)